MKPILFALGRNDKEEFYSSYGDLIRLIELGGFNSCRIGDIDFSLDVIYIITPMNGEFYYPHNGVSNVWEANKNRTKRCKLVWLNIERPLKYEGQSIYTEFGVVTKYLDYILLPDRAWFESAMKYAPEPEKLRLCTVGSHPNLPSCSLPLLRCQDRFEYDLAPMGYASHRRSQIFGPLFSTYGLRFAPNGWGEERTSNLCRSRAVLNIHQDEFKVIEPLRFAMAAAHRTPLVTETCHNYYPLADGVELTAMDFFNPDRTVNSEALKEVERVVRHSYEGLVGKAINLWNKLCDEFRFDRIINRVAEEL